MPKRRLNPEQVVTMLRQIEVMIAQGKPVQLACREAGISDKSYYRWRKEYGGLDQARRLKELEKEDSGLRRLVADLSLEKQVLKDISAGIYGPPPGCKVFQVHWTRTVCVNLSGLFVRRFIASGHDGYPRPTGTS